MLKTYLSNLVAELEQPRSERPFGSGWLSGSAALLCAVTATLMVVALRNPDLLTTPELAMVRDSALFRPFLYLVLITGYVLSALSLALRPDKTLGFTAMAATLLASFIGSLPTHASFKLEGAFLGLDFFVLNVLFMGFLFVPLERLFPRNRDQVLLREEWREDLFYYFVSSLLVQVLTFLTLAPSRFMKENTDLGTIQGFFGGLPWLVQLLLIMLFTDLVQYWVHRMFHRIPALWRFHSVHHSAKSLDWIAGARMHFVEIVVLRALTATPMFVLGFEESAIQAYILIVYVYSAFIHANVSGSFGWLEKLVVVPRFHHWHHGEEREAIDVNFAIHFPVIDKIFGTHHMPEGRWPKGYGIKGHPVPRGYWRQFLYPFQR
ncbi:sterol desaturase family protein [Methylobacterium brachythecii]|uniref:Sterol desaturase n=1 Tax=Methylobacterium brachythecii TaxID=1176177 RepID=A0A7W6AGR2_9HYPH|nr:sterol desaturase family protein [Methylobacterium brachythecii]MBB3903025.1 sterol desaturase/sphingolipid hydroxylase (fatty acid hydroxylase superfamily) [Methylobacterium brachythecii]GLS45738.1 sterol desaturase [Methylobacterium brachythecii]